MDCQTTRSLFSQRFDDRLPPAQASHAEGHLASCGGCRSEWVLYARVFSAVASTPTELAERRPLRRPSETPGAAEVAPFRAGSWSRVRVAAAILVLLAVSHVAVFEIARGRPVREEPFPTPTRAVAEAEPASRRSAEVLPASFVREKVRDHADAAGLLLRQINYFPDEADDECRSIVGRQLDMLRSRELREEVRSEATRLGYAARPAGAYLDDWDRFTRVVDSRLRNPESTGLVRDLKGRLARTRLPRGIHQVQTLLSGERAGRFFRAYRKDASLFDGAVTGTPPEDVALFLAAQDHLLMAHYPDAAESFRRIPEATPWSHLVGLSRYMASESYLRSQRLGEAYRELTSLDLRTPLNPAILQIDPVCFLFQIAQRGVDPRMGGGSRVTFSTAFVPTGRRHGFIVRWNDQIWLPVQAGSSVSFAPVRRRVLR